MIIACPACATRYVVPDASVGIEGRTVRCAKCRHSWHQDGPELDLAKPESLAEMAPSEPAAKAPVQSEPRVPPPPIADPSFPPSPRPSSIPAQDDTPAGDHEQPAPTVVETAPAPAPPEPEDDYGDGVSQFDYQPPFRPRRNPLKLWTAAAAVFAVLALGTVVAVNFVGLPDWVPVSRPTFAMGQPDLVLEFPEDQQDRRELPNGTEFFGATGTIKNTGREARNVPPLLIVLRDERDRIVYSWEVVPPQSSLSPGESMTINEAVTDVPKSAKFAEIGWKPA